jgi:glycosyltransferase involved in cell wall biosynthesis
MPLPKVFPQTMRKIVHLTSVHDALDVRIFHKECKSLAKSRQHEVIVVAPDERTGVIDGVTLRNVPPVQGRLARATVGIFRVFREARRQRADIYHFHDPELVLVGLVLQALGSKVIYDIHEDYSKVIHHKPYIPRLIRQPLAWVATQVENLAARRFSALVAATPTIGRRFEKLNGNTVVIHNFPDLKEMTDCPDTQRAQADFAYIGLIGRQRGMVEVVEALGLLPAELKAKLKLAGWYSPPEFRNELVNLPGWKCVEDVGLLQRPAVRELLSKVTAGVVLCYPRPELADALPTKLFEYMAMGVPVIASDFPLMRQIVLQNECGLLVDPQSPRAIADAMEFLIRHPEEAEKMGERGRRAAHEQYNWQHEEKELLHLYSTL